MNEPVPKRTAEKVSQSIDDKTLRQFVGYGLKRAFNRIQSDLAQTLKVYELRMLTYTALVLIIDNPGLRQSQLADAMDIERPNLVLVIDELEQRGLIFRDKVPSDRRAHALKATLAGQRLYEQAVAAVIAHEEKLLKGIDENERAQILATLSRIERS